MSVGLQVARVWAGASQLLPGTAVIFISTAAPDLTKGRGSPGRASGGCQGPVWPEPLSRQVLQLMGRTSLGPFCPL